LGLPNTVEECHVVISNLLSIIEHQQKQIDVLTSRVSELEARLNQNSGNSSRPPSSDGTKRRSGVPKDPKDRGGQKGHSGRNLEKVDKPDKVVRLTTDMCSCGRALDADSGEVEQTYQLFDLPGLFTTVTALILSSPTAAMPCATRISCVNYRLR
jgi:transposase